jgi:hypothetical protein
MSISETTSSAIQDNQMRHRTAIRVLRWGAVPLFIFGVLLFAGNFQDWFQYRNGLTIIELNPENNRITGESGRYTCVASYPIVIFSQARKGDRLHFRLLGLTTLERENKTIASEPISVEFVLRILVPMILLSSVFSYLPRQILIQRPVLRYSLGLAEIAGFIVLVGCVQF